MRIVTVVGLATLVLAAMLAGCATVTDSVNGAATNVDHVLGG